MNTKLIKQGRNRFGKNAPNWQGGTTTAKGRILLYSPNHKKAYANRYVLRYVLVAEKALGKPLPDKTEIHHIDKNGCNDKNNNLVVCENRAYHQLLHRRERAYVACGNPTWRKCKYCKQYDDPDNLVVYYHSVQHKECRKDDCKKRYLNIQKTNNSP